MHVPVLFHTGKMSEDGVFVKPVGEGRGGGRGDVCVLLTRMHDGLGSAPAPRIVRVAHPPGSRRRFEGAIRIENASACSLCLV